MGNLLQNMFGREKRKMRSFNVIISLLLLVACGTKSVQPIEGFTMQGPTQGTTYSIIIAEKKLLFSQKEIDLLLAAFDTILSTYIPTSHISKLNDCTSSYRFEDKHHFFKNCYTQSLDVYQKSGNLFDPSVYPLIKAWGFFNKDEIVPSENEIADIMSSISFEPNKYYQISFEGDSVIFTKHQPAFKLDFNAIAQGYSVDVLADFIESKGHKNYYIEIGGEIRVAGKNRSGEKWQLGIDIPENTQEHEALTSISVTNCGIATSGNYRNFFEKNGKKYGHIVSPKTGFPIETDVVSVTVLHQNAALADAYATVFTLFGKEKTLSFLKENKEIQVILLYLDHQRELQIYSSPNIKQHD